MANQKRSEVRELQDYLASNKLDQKKQAVRKVIFFINFLFCPNKNP